MSINLIGGSNVLMRLSTAAFAMLTSASALADKGASAEFNLPFMNYSSTTVKTKPDGGKEVKETTAAFDTAEYNRGYLSVYVGPAVLTVWYPFADYKKVGAGWTFSDNLFEVGVTLGLNSYKQTESKVKDNSNTYGLYFETRPQIGPVVVESTLTLEAGEQNGKKLEAGSTTLTDVRNSTAHYRFISTAFVPLTNNLSYGAGFWVDQTDVKSKKPEKFKEGTFDVGLTLASLRLYLN